MEDTRELGAGGGGWGGAAISEMAAVRRALWGMGRPPCSILQKRRLRVREAQRQCPVTQD